MISSRAQRFRVQRWAAERWLRLSLLAMAVATIMGAVLATAAGAHRTATAPDRYAAAVGNGIDLKIEQPEGRPVTEDIAGLPAVESVEAFTFMFVAAFGADRVPLDALAFAGTIGGAEARLVDGRAADPSRPGEFVATPSFIERTGLEVGDSVDTASLTTDDIQLSGYDIRFATGARRRATLVGVMDGPTELEEPTPIMLFSPALLDEDVATATTIMAVALAPGETSADLRRQIDELMPGNAFKIDPATTLSDDIRDSVRAQSVGLWILAAANATAAVAAIGILLTRIVRLSGDEERSLSSLGYTDAQLVGESAGRAALVVVAALVPAVVLAVAASGLFPFAFVGRIEPDPGVRFDALVLVPGVIALGVAAVVWVGAVALARGASTRPTRPSAIDAIAVRSPFPTLSTGLRFAFMSRSGERASVAAALGGSAVTFGALVGALTFGVSLERLVEQGPLHGDNYDAMLDNGAEEIRADVRRQLLDDPGVRDVQLYRADQARLDDGVLPVIAGESLRGALDPVVLSGRLPAGADEIAIGRVSARLHDVGIGDVVTLSTAAATVEFEVTGFVLPPGIRGNDLIGQGSVLHRSGYERLFPGDVARAAVVRVADGADGAAAIARLGAAFGLSPEETELDRPPSMIALGRITFVPYSLAGLLVVLAGILLTGSTWMGVRRRDRPAAVLRALGADRRWLVASEWWQAIVATLVPATFGGAGGLIVGRLVYRAYADRRGVVTDPATPWALGLAAIAGLVVLGVVVATIAGRRARRDHPAFALRTG